MVPAGLTSESMRARSDLCCECHYDLSLGTAFSSDAVGCLILRALRNCHLIFTKYWCKAVQRYLNSVVSAIWNNTNLC